MTHKIDEPSETQDKYYLARFKPNPARVLVWKEIIRFLKPYILHSDTVVDLGAGYCDFINNIKARKKIAVDYSNELPKYADHNVVKIQSSATNLEAIASASVNLVFASNLFEHFDDTQLEQVMAEVKRVLVPNGKLILMQPNYRLAYKTYFDDFTHKKVFSGTSLESFLVAHDFAICLARPRFLPFSMKSNPSFVSKYAPRFFSLIVRAYLHSPIKPFAGQMLFVAESLS